VIGKRLAWRRRVDGLADGMDVGGSRNTWRSGILGAQAYRMGPADEWSGQAVLWVGTYAFIFVGRHFNTSPVDVRLGLPMLRFRRSRLAIREPRPLRKPRAKGWRWESPRWVTRVGEVVVRSDFGPLICRTCRPCK